MSPYSRPLTAVALAAALLFVTSTTDANTPQRQRQAPSEIITKDNDNLWNLGAPYDRYPRYTRQQWMVAAFRRNPDAFVLGNMHRLRTQVPIAVPTEAEVAAEDLAAAEALITRHYAGLASAAPMPPLTPLPGAGVPGSTAAAAPAASGAALPAASAAPSASASASASLAAAQAPSAPASAAPSPSGMSVAVSPIAAPAASAGERASTPTSAASSAASTPPAAAASGVAGSSEGPAPVASAASAGVSASPPRAVPVPVTATGSGNRWLWPVGLLGAGLIAAFGFWAFRRSRTTGQDFGETISTFFQDTIQLVRKSSPKVITVSNAAADMARSVERLASTSALVRGTGESAPRTAAGASDGDVALKLDIARTQLELGRREAAVRLLEVVLREGDAAAQAIARDLMGPTPDAA